MFPISEGKWDRVFSSVAPFLRAPSVTQEREAEAWGQRRAILYTCGVRVRRPLSHNDG
jgi:hypothetical protein